MGSKGWGFSSADVGVITNHQSKFKYCLFRTKFLINGKCFQPQKPLKPLKPQKPQKPLKPQKPQKPLKPQKPQKPQKPLKPQKPSQSIA